MNDSGSAVSISGTTNELYKLQEVCTILDSSKEGGGAFIVLSTDC